MTYKFKVGDKVREKSTAALTVTHCEVSHFGDNTYYVDPGDVLMYEDELELEEGPQVVDIYNIDKPWGELSPEEKGALLLHHHEGGEFQVYDTECGWYRIIHPTWGPSVAYRAYKKPEPVVGTAVLHGRPIPGVVWGNSKWENDTHKITFKTIDGEPDCGSIKMEKLL